MPACGRSFALVAAEEAEPWGVVLGGEPRERERGEHQPEVAQRDVVVARVAEQVDDDPGEPCGDDVGGVAGLDRDGDAGDDLDHADDVHRVEGAERAEVVDPWGEIVLPVDEGVGELVYAHHDRQHREADAQEGERLVGGIPAEPGRACAVALMPRSGWDL